MNLETLETLNGKTFTVVPSQTGWTTTYTFSMWEKGATRRLYVNYLYKDRKGSWRNRGNKGFFDMSDGKWYGDGFAYKQVEKILTSL